MTHTHGGVAGGAAPTSLTAEDRATVARRRGVLAALSVAAAVGGGGLAITGHQRYTTIASGEVHYEFAVGNSGFDLIPVRDSLNSMIFGGYSILAAGGAGLAWLIATRRSVPS